ncbi:MAG: tail fiber protein [Mucilaginibacter sp.]
MNSPYIGQIFMYGYDWAPKNYALCANQQLAIQTNQALFSILGTTFGGNGVQTFALPDLRGRTYVGWGQGPGLSNYDLGEMIGTESVTLLQSNLPTHNHLMNVNNGVAVGGDPTGAYLSQGPVVNSVTVATYSTSAPNAVMNTGAIASAGGNQPVSVLQPYLAINFSICLYGLFPSRN